MKYKLAALALTTTILAISVYAVMRPSYDLGLFVSLSWVTARIRILLAIALFSYVFLPVMRIKLIQIFMISAGAILLFAGVSSIFSPLLFGHLTHYIALGDVIMAVEGGVLSILVGLELPVKQFRGHNPLLAPSYYTSQLSKLDPQKLLPSNTTASEDSSAWQSRKTAAA